MESALLAEYERASRISATALAQLTNESDESAVTGHQLYLHYRQQPNIAFARALLADLSVRYVTAYTQGGPATTEGLRLTGYLIGLHQDVRDSLLLWRTKQLTFDTVCEFDIQLVAFAGITQTQPKQCTIFSNAKREEISITWRTISRRITCLAGWESTNAEFGKVAASW